MFHIVKTNSKVSNNTKEHLGKKARKLAGLLGTIMFILIGAADVAPVQAVDTWVVTVMLHEATSLSDDDADGPDDIYWKTYFTPTFGTGETKGCNFFRSHTDDVNHITPDWGCTAEVSGGRGDPEVQIVMELWDHDTTSGEDHFDIHPRPDKQNIVMGFKPQTQDLRIEDLDGWEDYRCALGRIRLRGLHGDDFAEVVFSVSASQAGSPAGDSDGDGLLDSWEICGVEGVDLPAMGADPLHKDLFVEIDWMVDNDGTANDHSHAPWLPSLINAWNEFNVAPVTNPDGANGIALHVDVGNLYTGYRVDFNGDRTAEINTGPGGNIDMNGDGIPDIGNLGALGFGTAGGGNRLGEITLLTPAPGTDDSFGPGSTRAMIKAANFDPIRNPVFRYAVFAHQISDSSGIWMGGLAECVGACNDFIVHLGTIARQRLDTDFDGVPNPLAPELLGPAGLPVDGTIAFHTGVFLHELGHTLGLGHGGGDGVNNKPNYLSIMSNFFAFSGIRFSPDGDLFGDRLIGIDFDNDGVQDASRFMYSDVALPTLTENNLNEPAGIGHVLPALTRFGPSLDLDSDSECDVLARGFDTCFRPALSNQPIDWNRDTDTFDGGVNSLQPSPPYRLGIPTDINNDGVCVGPGPDGILQTLPVADDFIGFNNINGGLNRTCDTAANSRSDDVQIRGVGNVQPNLLTGFNDYERIQNGGLVFRTPGNPFFPLDLEELEELERNTLRVAPLPDESFLADRCEASERITFEEFPIGTSVSDQYAPLAHFLKDDRRKPMIVGPAGRSGLPTQSPAQSLANNHVSDPVPLVIEFDSPQRFVGLYLGRVTGVPINNATLTAYDVKGNPMGRVSRVPPAGITGFLGVGAIFPDQLIAKIELSYLGSPEPVHIDDLILCQTAIDTTPPDFPPPPSFGDLSITVNVEAKGVSEGGDADGEPGHHLFEEFPLIGVPITADGVVNMTDFSLNKNEGDHVTLVAPPTFDTAGGSLTFDHWELDGHIFFTERTHEIAPTFLRDATLTAVYTTQGGNHSIYLPFIIKN